MKWQWNQELFIEMCSAIHKQLNCSLSPVQTPSPAIAFCWAVSLEQNDAVSKDMGVLNSSKILLQLKFGSLFWHSIHHPPRTKITKRFGSSYVVMAWTCVRWGLGWILRKGFLPWMHWNRLLREVVTASSLPGLKKPLDNVLGNMMWLLGRCYAGPGVGLQYSLWVPPNPEYSIIL